jgi:hypothetical protein
MLGDLLGEMAFESLSLIEVPVTLAGKKYVLREMSGDAGAKFRSAAVEAAKKDGDKITVSGKVGELNLLLVSLCLFSKDEGGFLHAVDRDTIGGWPDHVINTLAKRAQALSKQGEVSVGKSSTPTGTGSDSPGVCVFPSRR